MEISFCGRSHTNVDAQGPGGYGNPLQTAAYRKSPERVRFLLQRGLSREALGRFGTALEIAIRYGEARSSAERQAEEDTLVMLTGTSLWDTLRKLL